MSTAEGDAADPFASLSIGDYDLPPMGQGEEDGGATTDSVVQADEGAAHVVSNAIDNNDEQTTTITSTIDIMNVDTDPFATPIYPDLTPLPAAPITPEPPPPPVAPISPDPTPSPAAAISTDPTPPPIEVNSNDNTIGNANNSNTTIMNSITYDELLEISKVPQPLDTTAKTTPTKPQEGDSQQHSHADFFNFFSSAFTPPDTSSKHACMKPFDDIVNKLRQARERERRFGESDESDASTSEKHVSNAPANPSEFYSAVQSIYNDVLLSPSVFSPGLLPPSIVTSFFPQNSSTPATPDDPEDPDLIEISISSDLLGLTVENILERTIIRSVVPGGGADHPHLTTSSPNSPSRDIVGSIVERIGASGVGGGTEWGTHFENIDGLRQSLRPLKLGVRRIPGGSAGGSGLGRGREVMNYLVSGGGDKDKDKKSSSSSSSRKKKSTSAAARELSQLSDALQSLLILFCFGNMSSADTVRTVGGYLIRRRQGITARRASASNTIKIEVGVEGEIEVRRKNIDDGSSKDDVMNYFGGDASDSSSTTSDGAERRQSSKQSSSSSSSSTTAPLPVAEILSRLQTDLSFFPTDAETHGIRYLFQPMVTLLVDFLEAAPVDEDKKNRNGEKKDEKNSVSSPKDKRKKRESSSSPRKDKKGSSTSAASDEDETSIPSTSSALLRLLCRASCDAYSQQRTNNNSNNKNNEDNDDYNNNPSSGVSPAGLLPLVHHLASSRASACRVCAVKIGANTVWRTLTSTAAPSNPTSTNDPTGHIVPYLLQLRGILTRCLHDVDESVRAVTSRGLAELVESSLSSDAPSLLTVYGTLPWLVLMLERGITDPLSSLRASATDILWMVADLGLKGEKYSKISPSHRQQQGGLSELYEVPYLLQARRT